MNQYTVIMELNGKRHKPHIVEAYDRYDAAVKAAGFGAKGTVYIVREYPLETRFVVKQDLKVIIEDIILKI